VSIDSISYLYLELLKKSLTRAIDNEHYRRIPQNDSTLFRKLRSSGYRLVEGALNPLGLALVQQTARTGETMIGIGGLNNIQECVEDVLENEVPGDLVETGVWRGGAVIFMRALLKVCGDLDRHVWAFDSFEGLPRPNEAEFPQDKGDNLWSHSLGVSLEEVKENFRKYEMLDDRVHFVQGWFRDTIPTAPIVRIAVLRLDGDMYESTMQVLDGLYSRVQPGGYVIVDDYVAVKQCTEAVHDFRSKAGVTDPLHELPGNGAYWRKGDSAAVR